MATSNSQCGSTTAVCYEPATGGGLVPSGVVAFLAGDSLGNIAAICRRILYKPGVSATAIKSVRGQGQYC